MGRAYRTVAALAALDRQRVRAHQTTLASLREVRKELEARRAAAARLEASARASASAAARAVEARAALVARIDAQRDLNAQLAGELDAARAKLAATVSSLAPGAAPALPFRPFRGALDWPVSGAVATRFGVDRSSKYGTAVARNGIEIAAPPVPRSSPSTRGPSRMRPRLRDLVPSSSSITGTGRTRSTAICRRWASQKGRASTRGPGWAPSARRPATGTAALYFEVRIDGKPSDPLQWLKPRFRKTP